MSAGAAGIFHVRPETRPLWEAGAIAMHRLLLLMLLLRCVMMLLRLLLLEQLLPRRGARLRRGHL